MALTCAVAAECKWQLPCSKDSEAGPLSLRQARNQQLHASADGGGLPAQVRVSEYNQLKGQLAALNRKRTGNLAVRDLAALVDSEDAVATENLVSLFVVVPKTSKADWLGGYERLSEYVVRRCSCWSMSPP
jgi:V-ATPase subunit C